MPKGNSPVATVAGVFGVSVPSAPTSYCETLLEPPLTT
jgi:hypothetical protein